jgi:hypothetical protein
MRTTLTRALVGLGLAGALFLGAGAAVAQTADDSSSSSYLAECCRQGRRRAPTPSAGRVASFGAGWRVRASRGA